MLINPRMPHDASVNGLRLELRDRIAVILIRLSRAVSPLEDELQSPAAGGANADVRRRPLLAEVV